MAVIYQLDQIVERGIRLDTNAAIYNRDLSVSLLAQTLGFVLTGTLTSSAAYAVLADADATLTAAQHRGGVASVAAGANNRNITTLTAALLVSAFPGAAVGQSANLSIVNLKAANTVTLVGGTGVTIVGVAVVSALTSGTYKMLFTNVTSGAEAVQFIRV